MCGRFKLTASAGALGDLFEIEEVLELTPRYNIAPSQQLLAVRRGRDGQRRWAFPRWGLIPSWAKERAIGNRLINARAETAASKPAFRSAMKRRRCLIAADGFYEWQRVGPAKQPHLIRFADGRPFAFAGLWERWHDPDGEVIDSCTILTTEPNQTVAPLHNRMPVIVPPASYATWLQEDPLDSDTLQSLLAPHPDGGMESFPVSTRVNSPRNDDPGCVERLGEQAGLPLDSS